MLGAGIANLCLGSSPPIARPLIEVAVEAPADVVLEAVEAAEMWCCLR